MDTVKEAFKYAEETLKQGIKRLSSVSTANYLSALTLLQRDQEKGK